MPLTLNRGVAEATFAQLRDASSDINNLSTLVTDKKRASTRAMMIALVTDHPGMVADPTARVVYKSCAHMQPWKKAGVLTGNRHWNQAKYVVAYAAWQVLDAAATAAIAAWTATPNAETLAAKNAAIAAAAAALPEAFDATVDWTMITPDWDYETGAKLVIA